MALLEVSVYYVRYNEITLKATAVGFVGMCIDNNPIIISVPHQTAYVNELYTYDVNTTVPNDVNVTFYDNTNLFNINNETGVISFVPDEGDIGDYYINISVISNCGLMTDTEMINFTVAERNRPPSLIHIPDQAINQSDLFIYDVNATDPDNDTLFFGDNTTMFQINSQTGLIYFVPGQEDVGNNSVLIWVIDGKGGIDWQVVNFEVIDVNDAPVLQHIGAQTAIINETYTYDVNATDVDVKPEWNNLTFYDNATFFNISPKTGLIQFFVNGTYNGTYSINMTVSDGNLSDTEIVSFSVVAINHPPNITSWYPENYTVEMNEGESEYFNITKFDLDGTIPSSQWYLDGRELTGQTEDEYIYYASFTSAGTHNITVVISDGQLTDSHEWVLTVKEVYQPPAGGIPPSGEAKPPPCIENWRCSEWSVCPVYELQTRTCRDLNNCGTTDKKPEESRKCTYTPQPSCNDGITNCHDGGCEIWIDCGGPCPQCATCSDRIKNCHKISKLNIMCEEAIDCGGPCPPCGLEPVPPVCGNYVCESGELFSCAQDCGLFFFEFIMIVIILGAISVSAYKAYEFAGAFYRKNIRPLPYTNMELLGASTLRKIHLVQLEMGKKPVRTIVSEFSFVMRDFFEKAFEIRKKFTYIELSEVARKRKIDKPLANRIDDFAIKMTEIEYRTAEPSITELSLAIKAAIQIVERLAGIRLHDSLEKKAEDELMKIEPEEEKIKLSETPEKVTKYVLTDKDKAGIETLKNLIAEGEKAAGEKRTDEAEKIYSRIREIYDGINPDVKKELYSETVRIIKLYNNLMKNAE
jgi:hypothetical protein